MFKRLKFGSVFLPLLVCLLSLPLIGNDCSILIPNRPPELSPIGNKQVDEGDTLQFTVTATDPDAVDALAYTAGNLPTGSSFDEETRIFTWTPAFDDAGSYQDVLFTVTDNASPALDDSETITITVGDVNRPPALNSIGNKQVDEDEALQFTVTATDPDTGDTLTYAAGNLPPSSSFDEDTHIFTWTPASGDAGSYQDILFTVTDNGSPVLNDSETITITVGDVNRPPELSLIGNKQVNEDEALQFTVEATDPDTGDTLIYTAANLPPGSEFDETTQTFTWTPGFGDAGSYQDVLFTVTDSGSPTLDDSETITITVGNVNRPPELSAIGNKQVDENDTLQFTVTATDPDTGDALTYVAGNLPPGSEFDEITQTFTWTPGFGNSGSYQDVLFTVTDNGSPALDDSETITITVGDVNRPPELRPVGNKQVDEGDTLQFTVAATDPDAGGTLTYTAANLPPGSEFDETTQTFTWTPGFGDAGSYQDILFTVTDNGSPALDDSETITITVGDVNRPPELTPIGNKQVDEGDTLQFTVAATDPDTGDTLIYTAATLPPGSSFDEDTHMFTWTPGFGDAGSYQDVLFTVTDNGSPALDDSETITITVGDVNQPPELSPIGNKHVDENETLQFTITATDPDAGDTLTYTAGNLPPGSEFDETTQTFTWTPGFGDANSYQDILFTVTDNGSPALDDSETITITVGDVNRPPVLSPIGNKQVNEDETLQFTITATDPDAVDTLAYTAGNLPPGSEFDETTQTFTWTPGFGDAGSYQDILFTVTDNGSPALDDSETITITVGDVNRPPELRPIGNKQVDEGDTLQFTVTATDPDTGDTLIYTAGNLPPESSFDEDAHIFTWTPGFGDAGSYQDVLFTVTDDGSPALDDSETITITVGDVNRPPELRPIGNKQVDEDETLQFTVTATDPDAGDALTYSASNLPPGSEFDETTQTFTWTPGFGDANSYQDVLFTVTDNGSPALDDSETITITVGDVNRPPEMSAIGNKQVDEGNTLHFTVTATDPDTGDTLAYTAGSLPPGSEFDETTQTFTWTPGFGDANSYQDVLFTVTDSGSPVLDDSETITITVGDVNRPPELSPIGNKQAEEDEALQFTVTATDPDAGDTLTYTAGNLPPGSEFDEETHIFTWTPAFGDAGSYQDVLFTVTDNGSPALDDSEAITITVGDVNRPPEQSPIGNKQVDEDATLQFTVTATDPDAGDTLAYTAGNLPPGSSFDEDTHIFTWTPGFSDAGSYQNVLFTVTDNGSPALDDSETITITVNNVLQFAMVTVPAGTFTMGRTAGGDDENGVSDELPRHDVYLDSYEMGEYEVTNAEYAYILNWALDNDRLTYTSGNISAYGQMLLAVTLDPCQIDYSGDQFVVESRDGYSMEDHPVIVVTWHGAVTYCNWLSEVNGLTPCYDTSTWNCDFTQNGYRLPTEAEWERAAAWDGSKHWIYSFQSDTNTSTRANYNSNNPLELSSYPYTTPAGYYNGVNSSRADSQSPVGCYDMSGNVWEWCHDLYAKDYYGISPENNPTGPASGSNHVLRGGSWLFTFYGFSLRSAYRGANSASSAEDFNGFRISRNN
ncbi:putative Ig domain-containing protein [Candidatus Hydrogenedentota bacterium]